MDNVLFPQSDVADPYTLYAQKRATRPVFFDERNGIWALYRHADCKRILGTGSAHIPGQNAALLPSFNEAASMLLSGFARLANPPRHANARQAVMQLMACMQAADPAQLLARLIGDREEFDWVDISKKLPALAVLTAFGFSSADIDTALPNVERMTKIMLPNKSPEQVQDINAVADVLVSLTERHLARAFPSLLDTANARHLHVSNLVGLLVQSYDAGRGSLSNALLQAIRREPEMQVDWERHVVETLRFDPPIQNTRRVLTEDVELEGVLLSKGAAVLVVLASANRDEHVFEDAARFDAARANNGEHLTFGSGMHSCVAHRFATRLAADALAALSSNGRLELLEQDIHYEAMVNARLPKRLRLRYSS
ncbi:MAG TPA: cytochrome P450 [Noviherbaspirillum sp.]|nr:cytochrome P450 [Noviherbaspirillum sp.]